MAHNMTYKKTAVFGMFAERSACERAADELIASGFSPADLSALAAESLAPAAEATGDTSPAPHRSASASSKAKAALSALGVSEPYAVRSEALLRTGGVLLCLYCESARQIESAKEILARRGASEIAEARVAEDTSKSEGAKGAAAAE